MHNQSHHNYPDNTVLLVLSSLSKTMSLTLTGNELGTSTATISRALSAAREFFGDELFVRSGPRMVPTARMRELLPDINDVLHRLEKLSRQPYSTRQIYPVPFELRRPTTAYSPFFSRLSNES